jgi:hypothetical protein
MNEYESQLALRRIEFFAPGDALAIYLSDVLTPKGDHQRRLVIERGGDVVLSTDHFELDVDPAPNADDDYPLPGVLRISSPRVEGEIHIGRVLVAHDPMRALPQPLRFLLSFKSRPHRVWVDSAYELRVNDLPVDAASGGDHTSVGGSTRALRGSGITNITFTNPLPDHSDHGGAVTGPSLRRPGA